MSEEETKDQKRARLRDEEVKRAEKAKEAREERELEYLELLSKHAPLGERGKDFDVVDLTNAGGGFFVLKPGPGLLFTRYVDSKMTTADRFDFVSACIVEPTDPAALQYLHQSKPGAMSRLLDALVRLYGFEARGVEGK